MGAYRVAQNTQANLNGVVYGPGETFEASIEEARPLLAAGIVTDTEAEGGKAQAEGKPVEDAESKPVESRNQP